MQTNHISLINRITKKIRIALSPSELEIINESNLHIGHKPEFDGSGETHIRIRIISQKFKGMNKIMIHKKIYELLNDEINNGLHAISIEAFSPDKKQAL
ncbi:BolA family protein [Candidatus Liberibacter americanus]|uniref:Stress-induced morphogen n=1 Tax=Candidatus Liberibacter americanus str. Sao Paulo TaxID=1261131 RepID=U6B9D6_9HYPH|nr:BolA family protein [Candidatus Liberibacter americanus]AHA28332.1 Stress-induced morphogen [Candidatus Liberibacter americanus str. Sao Paulo]EMS36622.1 BolA family protein [Candidatus Liberibacter americanus PW_SP]